VSRGLAAALVGATLAQPLAAGEIPNAVLVLEAAAGTPGSDASGAPPRFVLLKDGRVFVGGTSSVDAGQLEKKEAQALLKRAEALRKLPGIGAKLELGGRVDLELRLLVLADEALEVRATGDPAAAPVSLAPLASLLQDLARFDHPSLRRYAPSSYALSAREARLVGGCRGWSFAPSLADVLARPRAVPAVEAEGWPTGALPASVCASDKRYAVTLRPLLPDEQP
jgi:hypothetical protein